MLFKACQCLVKEMCKQWVKGDGGGTPQTSPSAWVATAVGWGTLSLSLCSPGAAVLGGMAFTPLKPPELCTGEGLCGCWLQPRCCRAWFQPCLWRPIFNIKTNQRKWNLYYLLKKQVNRAEGSASRKPLGLVQGIAANILHPFGDSRQPQQASAQDSCWDTPG